MAKPARASSRSARARRGRRRRLFLWRPEAAAPIVGVVRTTEIRVAPEVGGQLAAIKVEKGDTRARRRRRCRTVRGRADRVGRRRRARRSPPRPPTATTSMPACAPSRWPRSRLRSPRRNRGSTMRRRRSRAPARWRADDCRLAAGARPGRERRGERACRRRRGGSQPRRRGRRADHGGARHRRRAGQGAASALAVLERRLDKTVLRAPADGVVSVIVAEVGENIRAGQPVLAIAGNRQAVAVVQRARGSAARPHGRGEGRRRAVGRARTTPAVVTELRAARHVRDLAGRARGRRSRPQYAAPAPRSAGRSGRASSRA